MPRTVQFSSSIISVLAFIHILTMGRFVLLAQRNTRFAKLLNFLDKVEVVFGLWAFVLLFVITIVAGIEQSFNYVESRVFTSPLFVFSIVVVASSRPILEVVTALVSSIARALPISIHMAIIWLSLTIIPLLGSLITEPAAMALAAVILRDRLFVEPVGEHWKYLTLAVLFVNISVGGTFTAYAAPPVAMIALAWGWDSVFVAANFGWKALIAVLANATGLLMAMRNIVPVSKFDLNAAVVESNVTPVHVRLVHIGFLAIAVLSKSHPVVFICLFLLFLVLTQAYEKYQSPLMLRESLLSGCFLGGLVLLGDIQKWWFLPLVASLNTHELFVGALGLTAVLDNATMTYLGSLIIGMSDNAKYMLQAGAVAGGGLTIVANAANPVGLAIVRGGFKNGTVGVAPLLAAAAAPTCVASAALLIF
ncbi:hypothetical protein WJ88_12200 [Burkholderia ubonensis]|nr:putative Na+/H+ antiporter [Burkholderia ubonensis]KVP30573.1 hypothetical protein WJ88_12200 [Burkholderia ubonensis]